MKSVSENIILSKTPITKGDAKRVILLFFAILFIQNLLFQNKLFAQNPNLHFAFNIGSPTGDQGYALTRDGSSNTFVTGAFTGTADFDPGAGTAILTATPPGQSIFVAKYNANGIYQWAFGMGNANGANQGYSIKVDGSNNVYVTGMFSGTVDFDPGPGTANLTGNGAGDIFVAKYNSSGAYQWAFKIGSTDWDRCQSVTLDGSGNVYITGYFRSTADFDPGPGTANLTVVGGEDIFVAKYNSSGVYQWAFNVGSPFDDHGFSLVVDGSSNVYVTGQFGGTADFDPSAGIANLTILTSFPGHNIFVAKYNAAGSYQWAFRVGGTLDDNAYSIAIDGFANIYITGWYQGTVDFDPGSGTANLTIRGAFLAKYNSGGLYQWALPITSSGNGLVNWGLGVCLDISNNVYITGQFSNTADFDPGPGTANLTALGQPDIFIAKYTGLGVYQWAFNVGGVWTSSSYDAGTSIVVDDMSNVYVTGFLYDTADFDPNAGTTILSSNGGYDAFLAKYSPCLLMATPGPISGNSIICSGSTNTYSISPVSGATSYTWSLPAGWTGSSITTSIITTASNNGGIISVVANNSCGSSSAQTLTITVNPSSTPITSISVNPSGAICSGTSVTFTATSSNLGGGAISTYDFKVNGVSQQSGASNTFTTTTLANTDVVNCIITITGGSCLTSSTATSNTITMVVNASVTPTVSIAASPSGAICAGASVIFTATASNLGGGTVSIYDFKVNGVSQQSTTSNTYITTSLVNNDVVTCTITITGGGSCLTSTTASSNTITMIVNTNVTPSVNITASPSGAICAGTSVTFTATASNLGGGSVSSYDFRVNGVSQQNTASNIYSTTSLTNSDVVTCAITITGGACLTSTTASSNTITIVVNATLTPTVSIAASPSGAICAGTSVTFTATTSNLGGGSVSSYDFIVNGVSQQNTASNIYSTTSLINSDVVTCTITITGGACLTSTSASSNTITMVVNASVTPTVSIAASPSGVICAGTSVTLTATASNLGGGAVSTYNFKVNGVSQQNTASNIYSTTSLINSDVVTCTITITGGASCLTSNTALSNSITMVVNATLTPTVSIAASPSGAICAGTSVTITATASNLGGGSVSSYDFKVNGVSQQNTASSIYSTTLLINSDVVTCSITITGGACLTSTTALSNAISMVVNASVTPTVNIAASPSGAICSGTSVTFTATSSNLGGGSVSIYSFTVNGISQQSSPSNTFTTNTMINNDAVTCSITVNGANCLTANTATSNTIAMIVTATVVPSLTITSSANNICPKTPVTFTAIPANVGTTPSYQWKLNGNNVGGNNLTYVNSNLANGDKINCIMSTTTSCSSSPFVYSDTITMIVKVIPVISFNPSNPTISLGSSVQLNATVTGSLASYLWTPSTGLNNPLILNPIANPVTTTIYNLKVVAANSCVVDKKLTVTVFKDIYIPNAFTPNGDTKNDVFRIPPGTSLSLQYFIIYDRYGNEVFKTRDINTGWDGTFKGAKSPNGAYTYLIKGSDSKGEVFLNGTVLVIR